MMYCDHLIGDLQYNQLFKIDKINETITVYDVSVSCLLDDIFDREFLFSTSEYGRLLEDGYIRTAIKNSKYSGYKIDIDL